MKKKVSRYIQEKREKEGALFFSLIDPLDHPDMETAINRAAETAEAGADIVLVGGSVGAQGDLLDGVVKGIKDKVNVPVVIFPGNTSTISKHADALYFMSLLNSRQPY